LLPVSLFGMAVSAAELPAMSGMVGMPDDVASTLQARLNDGLRRIAFFIVPSAMAFVALGDVIAAAIYRTGRFTTADAPLGVGDPRGVCGRDAGIDPRATVFVGLLRAP